MGKVLVIGCGGVAGVAIQKCAQNDTVFDEIVIASRTVSKCDALAEKLKGKTKAVVSTAQVDADNVEELVALINRVKPDIVLNLALPYQDLTIMDACLKTGVDYVTPPTTKQRIPMTPHGVKFTRNAARKKALRRILTIPGSGHTARNLKKRELPVFWEPALTPV